MLENQALYIMGLVKPYTEQDLKKQYKQKAKENHPDMPNGSARKFKELQIAYETLLHPQKTVTKINQPQRYTHSSILDIRMV